MADAETTADKLARQRQKSREKQARWLAKPGNAEKHRISSARCRQHPRAKEAHRLRSAKAAAENRDREKERAARWRAADPDRDRESKRNSYIKHAETRKQARKRYRELYPEKIRESASNSKGRRRAGGGRLSRGISAHLREKQLGLCNACFCDLSSSGEQLDHVVALANGGKHEDNNVQLLCPTCNQRKSTKDFWNFLEILEKEKHERPDLSKSARIG